MWGLLASLSLIAAACGTPAATSSPAPTAAPTKTPAATPAATATPGATATQAATATPGASPSSSAPSSPSGSPSAIGPGEGELNLVIWTGYAERGTNDPNYDWVTPFETKTGCKVNTTDMSDSNNGVSLIQSGAYDGISASGDATTRLIQGGYVSPIDTNMLPNLRQRVPRSEEPAA
jgi:putative spermidine/putrescine transport system substrate-binding protein